MPITRWLAPSTIDALREARAALVRVLVALDATPDRDPDWHFVRPVLADRVRLIDAVLQTRDASVAVAVDLAAAADRTRLEAIAPSRLIH